MPYAMGVPWWDYWLPCVALLNDRSITAVNRPAILHLDHRPAYSFDLWGKFAGIFAASLIRAYENTPYSPPEIMKTLMPCVRKMAAPGLSAREILAIHPSLGELFIAAIGKSAVSWKAADAGNILPSDAASLTGIFERFDQRLISSNAIFDAQRLFKTGKRHEVQSELIAAMNNTPDDPDVLAILGDLSFHRGDRETAGALLAKSIDLVTDAIFPLQTLGNVLWKCGRWEEALACYREILELAPEDQGTIKIAARLLWDLGRRREAVTFLKQALARDRDLRGVAELYDHYRKIGSPIRNKYWQIVKRTKLPFLSGKRTNSSARWH
jgi:tetratricopeptide (TPR) repeat protein